MTTVTKPTVPQIGRWAHLTAEAIGVFAKRAGLNTTQLRTRAGMSYGYYYARVTERLPFTLDDVDALCGPLGVTPLEVAQMATALGKVAPRGDDAARAGVIGRSSAGGSR